MVITLLEVDARKTFITFLCAVCAGLLDGFLTPIRETWCAVVVNLEKYNQINGLDDKEYCARQS
jgi:hypothetical protein